MKKIITILILSIAGSFIPGTSKGIQGDKETSPILTDKTETINASDSIVFDLSQAVVFGSTVEFPLFFSSDDTINAVDFSLKYDQSKFVFDTVLNLTFNLQVMSYFNTGDSTLRFTSNSLQAIPNNTPLVKVRFTVLSGQLCTPDISEIITYLNGDLCSSRVINCVINSVSDIENSNDLIQVFPNPATDVINISSKENVNICIRDFTGKEVVSETEVFENKNLVISSESFAQGMYFVRIAGKDFVSIKKVLVNR